MLRAGVQDPFNSESVEDDHYQCRGRHAGSLLGLAMSSEPPSSSVIDFKPR